MTETDRDSVLSDSQALEKVIDSFPEKEREKVVAVLEMTMMTYGGPIMPPHLLRELERIIPGGAERALRLTEKEQEHRHRVVEGEADTARWQTKVSLIAGLLAFAVLLSCVLYCAARGQTAAVVALSGIGAFGVVSHIIRLPKRSKLNDPTDQQD